MKKTALYVFLIIGFSVVFLMDKQMAIAATLPTFPSCINPQGTIKDKHDTGVHGIVGDAAEHTGADTVYSLTDDTVTQCFCPADGSGIQTDWWKMQSNDDPEIDELKNDGWIFIPDGSAWGLHPSSYVARNSSYSCLGYKGGGGGGGGSGGDGGSSGGSSSSSSSSTASYAGGGQIMSLASTGNSVFIVAYLLLGFTAVGLGLYLKK